MGWKRYIQEKAIFYASIILNSYMAMNCNNLYDFFLVFLAMIFNCVIAVCSDT